MTRKTKGRAGWHQHTTSNTFSSNSYFTLLSTRFKALIVTMAGWRFIPIGWADWVSNQKDRDNE
jgi:hypothetical protein